ncbi:MAG TPA: hypothetical protein VG939_00905 [Caulobacteraceae bacterium]|nr:hypothetical protein [Caulobacteraceae bacterium]
MGRWKLAAFAIVLNATLCGAARAELSLGEKVYDPYVKNGVTEVELRGGVLTGGPASGESGAIVEFEQGLNDRVSLALVGEIERGAGERTKLDSVGLEGVVYLGQVPRLGVDVGLYLEYEQRIHNESGVGEAKLLLAKQAGRFEGLANLIVQKPFTDRPGEGATAYAYAVQGTWDAGHNLRLGVQGFGALGDSRRFGGRQPHWLGPTVKWETHPAGLPGEIELQASWLASLGAARDDSSGQLKLAIEWERRF